MVHGQDDRWAGTSSPQPQPDRRECARLRNTLCSECSVDGGRTEQVAGKKPEQKGGSNMKFLAQARRASILVAALILLSATGVGVAEAAPVSPQDFTCGVTVFAPCNQTAHFSQTSQVGTPNPGASSCPAFVQNDYALIVGTGNGVEHSIINSNLDGWFTSTFTGQVTVTVFLDPGLTTPDPSVPQYSGQLTEWFGGSFNNKNFVNHDTFHLNVTAPNGSTLTVLAVDHSNTNAGHNGLPHSFSIFSCK
jgi:hypothetical protein